MHYKVNGVDSVKVGIWENGNYIGKKKIADYKVKYNQGVDKYTFNLLNELSNSNTGRIIIKFIQNGANNTSITDVRFQTSREERISFNNTEGYQNIEFPFSFKLTYTTPSKL